MPRHSTLHSSAGYHRVARHLAVVEIRRRGRKQEGEGEMSDNPYARVKGGRLTFKGGALATRDKAIEKKKKKKSKNKHQSSEEGNTNYDEEITTSTSGAGGVEGGEVIYTIDAAKKKKYEDLFPVEAKKFGYDPNAKTKSVEEALDDRVKKKADRYCK